MIYTVCAWCRHYLGRKPGGHGTSHGICLECKRQVLDTLNATR